MRARAHTVPTLKNALTISAEDLIYGAFHVRRARATALKEIYFSYTLQYYMAADAKTLLYLRIN